MNKYAIYAVSLFGTLFSGFLSGTKLFSNTCAFGESCPLFMGKPACYFGFVLFLALFALANVLVFRKSGQAKVSLALVAVSALGVLFSGKFVASEIIQWSHAGFEPSALGLPTCAYGLIFYVLALIFSLRYRRAHQGL